MATCISGPDFNITGNLTSGNQEVDFTATFPTASEETQVRYYEWYLDGELVAGNDKNFEEKVECGTHQLGLRILTADGWSGIKYISFQTCVGPTQTQFVGPEYVYEGSSETYQILAIYPGGQTADISSQYNFSTSEGSFNGSVLSIPTNNTGNDSYRSVLLRATKTGTTEYLEKEIQIIDQSIVMSGPASIDEGGSADFMITQNQYNISSQYNFTSTEGTFSGSVLSIPNNTNVNDDQRLVTVTATRAGFPNITKTIRINDKTSGSITGIDIDGPISVYEGNSYTYTSKAYFADGSSIDVTNQTQFTINKNRANFNGNILTVHSNDVINDDTGAEVTGQYLGNSDILLILIRNATLPFTYTTNWQFTEKGALKNHNGSERSYNSTNIPLDALWSVNPDNLGLRISYEDSANCPGGTNDLIQEGTALAQISINKAAIIKVNWEGNAERESSNYETAKFYVDNILLGSATSPGGGLKCLMGPVVSVFNYPQGLEIAAGNHNLRIECSTQDNLYHVGAYYQFSIELTESTIER